MYSKPLKLQTGLYIAGQASKSLSFKQDEYSDAGAHLSDGFSAASPCTVFDLNTTSNTASFEMILFCLKNIGDIKSVGTHGRGCEWWNNAS